MIFGKAQTSTCFFIDGFIRKPPKTDHLKMSVVPPPLKTERIRWWQLEPSYITWAKLHHLSPKKRLEKLRIIHIYLSLLSKYCSTRFFAQPSNFVLLGWKFEIEWLRRWYWWWTHDHHNGGRGGGRTFSNAAIPFEARDGSFWGTTLAVWGTTLAVWGTTLAVWGTALAVWGTTLAVWGTTLAVWNGF